MIRLIASDIDGTLLPEGSDRLNPEMFDVIRKLKAQGILFAAASGRSYTSISRLFAPVKDDIIFIADNGANVSCRGYETFCAALNRKDLEDWVRAMRARDDCAILVSSKTTVYVERADEALLDLLINGYHNRVKVSRDLLAEEDCMIKTAMFRRRGIAPVAEELIKEWKDRFHVMPAGDPWLDFVDYNADKGRALAGIQRLLKIDPAETMAFGDNGNDIGMLKQAGESYAVANAAEDVKKAARHIAASNREDGVLQVMKSLLG